MPEASQLSYFLIASLLIIITPGPDIIFLITQSLTNGKKAGLATALGLASGNLVHTLAAVLGISAVFQTSSSAFEILKIAGVCYLLYLAYSAIAMKKDDSAVTTEYESGSASLFVRGVLMNVLNPKVALFFLAFLPQFVDSTATNVWLHMAFYGITFTLLVVIVFGLIGVFAGTAQDKFFTHRSNHDWFRWITAAVFASLAVRLFFIER